MGSSEGEIKMKLSERLSKGRTDRPDEWTIDSMAREAKLLEEQIKPRSEIVDLIENQFNYKCTREKGEKISYGRQELRELLDFIYNSKPKNDIDKIK